MRVLVTGATGTLGRALLPRLTAAGHDLRAASRRPRESAEGAQWVVTDLRAGAGIDAAVEGMDVVVHAATAVRGDEQATRNLLAALHRSGRPVHLIYVSIVGVDEIPLVFYRTKLACERAIEDSGMAHTILRATQFHPLLMRLFTAQRALPVVLVPAHTSFQPVDTSDVAERLEQLVAGSPQGRVDDFGGPEILGCGELARRYLTISGRHRIVMPVHVPGRVGAGYRAGAHTTPAHRDGLVTFADYLATRLVV